MRIGFSHVLIALAVTMALAAAPAAETFYPLSPQPFEFAYRLRLRAAVVAADFDRLPPVGPFRSDESASPIIDALNPGDPEKIHLFAVGSETYVTGRTRRGDDLPALTAGFAYRPGRYVSVLSYARFDRAKALDSAYTGKKYRGLAGDVETSLLAFRKGGISAMLGRSRFFWGPRPVNLILSATAEPLDMLTASYAGGRITFNFLFARLDTSRPDATDSVRFPDRSFADNRYLAMHRLDIRIHRRVRLGLFEAVLYGGEGRPPELYYLNPLQFFHGAQLNENEDDNTLLGLDATVLAGRGVSFYGQLLVDDFQVDDESRGDQEPNELGFLAGAFMAGRMRSLRPDLRVEYVRITNRTYHQREPRNRYVYRNAPLGHPLGPDADSVALSMRFWPTTSFFFELEGAYRRRGEGSLDKPWDEPWVEVPGNYSEPFPTGVVEKAAVASFRAQGYVPLSAYTRKHLFLSLTCDWAKVTNAGNVLDRSETQTRLAVTLCWTGFTGLSVE